jgi:1-aminocyclopropane-1-carboxylate deaminase
MTGCHRKFLIAGQRLGLSNLRCHRTLEEVRAQGGVPYAIPAGASDHRPGDLDFANWAYEVQEQERQAGVFFDTIVVCAVTGSTQGS